MTTCDQALNLDGSRARKGATTTHRATSKRQRPIPKAVPTTKTRAAARAWFRALRGDAASVATALVLTLLSLHIPRDVVTTLLDPSWGAVLDYASGKGLQFGTDIVFSYGPLGYLAIGWFTGHGTGLRILFDLLMDFAICYGVTMAAWKTPLWWRVPTIAVFALLTINVQPEFIEMPLEIGLFCWTLLCLSQTDRRPKLHALILVAFAVIVSMIKFNLFAMAAISVGTVAASDLLRGNNKRALGIGLGYVGGGLCLWMLLGQNLFHLWAYWSLWLSLAAGYESAMGIQTSPFLIKTGIAVILLAFTVAAIRSQGLGQDSLKRRALFLAWISCILFLSWKHGFLRNNPGLVAGFVPLVAMALAALPLPTGHPWSAWSSRICAVACCVVAITMERRIDPEHFKGMTGRELKSCGDNLKALINPADHSRAMNQALDVERTHAQLPGIKKVVGGATVDVFGQNQAYALFNEMNYRPRPAFQNYFVYNAALMDMNNRAFAKAEPEYVLFALDAIDGRFPPMEDARVLRTVLTDYDLVAAESRFLLLKHRGTLDPKTTLLREGVVAPNQAIRTAEFGDADLWLEIHLEPTIEGRLLKLAYQPPDAFLGVIGKGLTNGMMFHAPASMLASGFIASPVALKNQDIMGLYTGKPLARPGGYTVMFKPGTEKLWKKQIQYKLYRIALTDRPYHMIAAH